MAPGCSYTGLEGQPFPWPGAGMQRVSWQDCVSPLQSGTKCSHPSKMLRGWCLTTTLAAGGSKTELFGNPTFPTRAVCWWAVGHRQYRLRPGVQRAGEGRRVSVGDVGGAGHRARCPSGLVG